MILPIIIGLIIGKFVSKRSLAIPIALLLGSAVGLIASYTLIPLLYPIFTGTAGLVVIPEFRVVGIMIFLPDFVVYTETIYMMTRSWIIDSVFVMTGAIFSVLGTWVSLSRQRIKLAGPFESGSK